MNKRHAIPVPSGHAIVIGGSIAGMLTARVLAEHFARVTIVERDQLSDGPEFRPGVPQARHAHAMLVRGQQIIEELFPGATRELLVGGATPVNAGRDLALYLGATRVQPWQSELTVIGAGRPLLEKVLYRRLRAFSHIKFLDGHTVAGLRTNVAGTRVTGIRVRRRRKPQTEPEVMSADLVVDAAGRHSRLPDWLEGLGFPAPRTTTVDAGCGYATQILQRGKDAAEWKALYCIPQAPANSRGGILAPLDGDRWQLTLTGLNGDHPPTDEAGFRAFARSLPTPEIYRVLMESVALSAPVGYRNAANRLRHYDELSDYLEGIVAVGDSVYALNPVYGQGMTVAALGAQTLGDALSTIRRRNGDDTLTDLPRYFQQRLAGVLKGPWQLATGQDLLWPAAADGHTPALTDRLVQRYFDRVMAAMTNDSHVAEAFIRVQNMVAAPTALFHPRIVWRTLIGQRRAKPASDSRQPQRQRMPEIGWRLPDIG